MIPNTHVTDVTQVVHAVAQAAHAAVGVGSVDGGPDVSVIADVMPGLISADSVPASDSKNWITEGPSALSINELLSF